MYQETQRRRSLNGKVWWYDLMKIRRCEFFRSVAVNRPPRCRRHDGDDNRPFARPPANSPGVRTTPRAHFTLYQSCSCIFTGGTRVQSAGNFPKSHHGEGTRFRRNDGETGWVIWEFKTCDLRNHVLNITTEYSCNSLIKVNFFRITYKNTCEKLLLACFWSSQTYRQNTDCTCRKLRAGTKW